MPVIKLIYSIIHRQAILQKLIHCGQTQRAHMTQLQLIILTQQCAIMHFRIFTGLQRGQNIENMLGEIFAHIY